MVNGPYCLITTSVAADLGTHPSLSTSAKALATVTAIIDGTGSIGKLACCYYYYDFAHTTALSVTLINVIP